MKNLGLSMLMFFGVVALSANLQAQTATNTSTEKMNCQQPCAKSAQTNSAATNYYIFTAAANEHKAETPTTETVEKTANCQVVCTKAAEAKVNCDPKDCPPGCNPANCKIKTCAPAATSATAVKVNQKPGNRK